MSPSHNSGSFDSQLRAGEDDTDGLADAAAVAFDCFCELDSGAARVSQLIGLVNVIFAEVTSGVALVFKLAAASLTPLSSLVCSIVYFCSAIPASANTTFTHSVPGS